MGKKPENPRFSWLLTQFPLSLLFTSFVLLIALELFPAVPLLPKAHTENLKVNGLVVGGHARFLEGFGHGGVGVASAGHVL